MNPIEEDSDAPWLDFHTHTTFSDGDLSLDEMVELALERGLTHLAITDHLFTHIAPVHLVALDEDSAPQADDELLEEIKGDAVADIGFGEYISELERIRADAATKGLCVFAGGEIDFLVAEKHFQVMVGALNRLDFLLVENINGGNWRKFKSLIESLEIPVGLAHMDIFSAFPDVPPKMLASAVAEVGVFVELNAASMWRVESLKEAEAHYAELMKRKQRFSFGTDLHDLRPIAGAVAAGWEFVVSTGLEPGMEWIRALSKGRETETG